MWDVAQTYPIPMPIMLTNPEEQTMKPSTTNKMNQNKQILIVSCDMASHCYASAKLAKIYAGHGHQVTLAGPSNATDLLLAQTAGVSNLQCMPVGHTTTKKQMNERKITSPFEFRHIVEGLWHPFPMPIQVPEYLADTQEPMYEPIRTLLQQYDYDVIIPMHSTITTVADAAESLGQDHKILMFSSVPYEPSLFSPPGTAWQLPRCFTNFPHVATYSAKRSWNPVTNIFHAFWKILDVLITDYMWHKSIPLINAQREKRGLKPMSFSYRGYCQRFPTLSVGGLPPFLDENSSIGDNVTVLGNLEAAGTEQQVPVTGSLRKWLDRSPNGIVYVGFGTGTVLSEQEAVAVTSKLHNTLKQYQSKPRILFALRTSEQQRLRHVFDKEFNEEPRSDGEGILEYDNGRVRIENALPQSALLMSGKVKVFVSHMGMGGFTEAAQAGVPLVCCPSGCDQYYNAARAADAGIGVISSGSGLKDIDRLVLKVLDDYVMAERAKKIARDLNEFDGKTKALEAIDRMPLSIEVEP